MMVELLDYSSGTCLEFKGPGDCRSQAGLKGGALTQFGAAPRGGLGVLY